MTTHAPWQSEGLHNMSGLLGQKTIKTMCDKRVSFADTVTRGAITCPECLAKIKADITACRGIADKSSNPMAIIALADQMAERWSL